MAEISGSNINDVADGEHLLSTLAARFPANAGVHAGRMLNGLGLKVNDKFFAYVSRNGGLVVKLPEDEVRKRVERGESESVTIGNRTMREWVEIPHRDGDASAWMAALEAARNFVAVTRE